MVFLNKCKVTLSTRLSQTEDDRVYPFVRSLQAPASSERHSSDAGKKKSSMESLTTQTYDLRHIHSRLGRWRQWWAFTSNNLTNTVSQDSVSEKAEKLDVNTERRQCNENVSHRQLVLTIVQQQVTHGNTDRIC